MEEKVWISQAPGMPMVEKTSTYERGTYYFFDAHNWRKVLLPFLDLRRYYACGMKYTQAA